MLKLLILACLLAVAVGVEIYYTPGAYYAPGAVYARSAAVAPLVYSRVVHAPAAAAVETYNSVQTPDSFQQQYRSDYKPLAYEYIY